MDKIKHPNSGVYAILNTVNDKVYIGSSIDVYKRMEGHKRELRKGSHYNRYLQRGWNKHGEDVFRFEVVHKVPSDKMLIAEQCWINFNKDNMYNLSPTAGNTLGVKATEETKRKISEANMGEKNSFYGKKHSEESLEKMSKIHKGKVAWNRGRKHSEETKKKMSEAKTGVTYPKRTEEWKKAQSERLKEYNRELIN